MKTIMRSSMSNEALPQAKVAITAPRDEPVTNRHLNPIGSSRGAMMATLKTSRDLTHTPHAAGATLSEVLISLLVMSIGVVSLATLFPISVLRSLQATQLTSAANLRYNVEAYLGVNPKLYTIGSPWQRATAYAVGDLVTPTGCCTASIVLYCTAATGPRLSGLVEPTWDIDNGDSTTDNDVTWQTYRLQNYVVDPLGKHLVETNYRQTTNGDYFGYNPTTNLPIQVLRAFPGVGAASEDAAADAATLSDSWISQVESNQISYAAGASSCSLDDLPYDLTTTTPVTPAGYLPSRIVLFDITGKISHVRPISAITGTMPSQTITWPSGVVGSGTLPSGFIPVRARVETKERRYSWLLSVRRSGDSFEMEVVVFFRRPFSGRDERVFPATFTAVTDLGYDEKYGVALSDDDGDDPSVVDEPGELGYVGSDDTARNWVVLQYDGTGEKPFVKKGGYVTDADNLRWYRILDVYESDTPANAMTKAGLNRTGTIYTPDAAAFGANTQSILLRVENKIIKSGPQPSGGAGGVPTGGAILMRNIIDVYPIRTRVISESQ